MSKELRRAVLVYLTDAERVELQALADQQTRSLSGMGRVLLLAAMLKAKVRPLSGR